MSIGERITELRSLCGMTQGDLARVMEVSRQAVSKWENGQAIPDAIKMIRLAEVLESDIEYISTGRRNYGRRPPVVIKSVETVETIVEKPVVQVVEKVVEKIVEKPVVKYNRQACGPEGCSYQISPAADRIFGGWFFVFYYRTRHRITVLMADLWRVT